MKIHVLLLSIVAMGCAVKPDRMPTVRNLEISKYCGVWYEIARFPHRFEKDLSHVTATYTLRDDGKVTVENRGKTAAGQWKTAKGVAKVPDASFPGKLKVSFFRPFYAPYWVLKLDSQYQTSMVGTPDKQYFWILSRSRKISAEVLEEYRQYAISLGFDLSKMEMVKQD